MATRIENAVADRKVKKVKMTDDQRAVAAALLGVSNAGQDLLFRGQHPQFMPKDIASLLNRQASVESATHYFVQNICEDDHMLQMFNDETKSWYKQLKGKSVEELKTSWDYYAAYFDALVPVEG